MKYRVDWDATDDKKEEPNKRCGKYWEMNRFYGKAKEEDQGALALVLDVAKAFERVSLPVVSALATHFRFQRRSCECCAGTSRTTGECSSKGCVAEPLQTITAILPESKWSCLLPRIVKSQKFTHRYS